MSRGTSSQGQKQGQKPLRLSHSERAFIQRALKYFSIRSVRIENSSSTATYPDIWVDLSTSPPTITVTQEWARQSINERMKRIVHELLHIRGFEHNARIGYVTYPDKDTFSVKVFKDIVAGNQRFSVARMMK